MLKSNSTARLLPDRDVCVRYGICSRTLFRWDRDLKLGFPKPRFINHRKYRSEEELAAWDQALAANRQAATLSVPELRKQLANAVATSLISLAAANSIPTRRRRKLPKLLPEQNLI